MNTDLWWSNILTENEQIIQAFCSTKNINKDGIILYAVFEIYEIELLNQHGIPMKKEQG